MVHRESGLFVVPLKRSGDTGLQLAATPNNGGNPEDSGLWEVVMHDLSVGLVPRAHCNLLCRLLPVPLGQKQTVLPAMVLLSDTSMKKNVFASAGVVPMSFI